MNTNKTMLWIFAVMLTGFFCAVSAMADVVPPEAFNKLTAVELAPGNAPGLNGGVYALSSFEPRFKERLPVQLSSAIAKVKRSKYRPSQSKTF
ncbi:MAG: hypothetical protein ACXWQO_01215 [Bdellovibrionota bacterium]